MPIAKFQMPDGRVARFEVPDGTTPEQAHSMMQAHFSGEQAPEPQQPDKSLLQNVSEGLGNLAAGAVRGAGSIGSTILAPYDMAKDALAGKGLSLESNRQRREGIDSGLQIMGADPNSMAYGVGKLGGEIAGTAGAGGVLGNALSAVPSVASKVPSLVAALRSGGFDAAGATGVKGMLTRAAGGAATGAASAGMVDPEMAGMGAGIGGALPVAAVGLGKAGKALGRAISGGTASPEVKALVERANQLGIDVPADRIVDSKPLNAIASSLNYVPLSGRAATEKTMQDQLNKALSRTFGQDSSNVTQALRNASEDLGGKFDTVLKTNKLKVDDQFLSDLSDHANMAAKELGTDGAKIINNQIDEIVQKSINGEIDGQAAYNIKKTLDRIGRRNSPEAYYAIDLKKSLMEALNRSLGQTEAAAFAKTRQQYGNMLSLEKLAKNGAEGDISIARLANMKNINSPDLQELADISAQFLKPREGQHGAMQRVLVGGVGMSNPAMLAGGMATGRLANALLNSNVAKNAVLGNGSQNQALINALRKSAPVAYQGGQLSGP